MKKIIVAVVVFIVVLAFTVPIFADGVEDKNQGQRIQRILDNRPDENGLSEWIAEKKGQTDDNLGQFLQWWKDKWGFKDLK